MKSYIFPGQGSQFVGMGKDLAAAFPSARAVFEEVDDALSQKLSHMMFEGPEADLNLTENTQPALMAVSVAVARVLQEASSGFLSPARARFVAGHSLGEYSALTAAGALSLSDAARLLKLRGQAMQRAVPVGVGAMAAILGLDLPAVADIVREAGGDVGVANDNSPGQVVISGRKADVERAAALATERGAKRAVMLPVSAPFHCGLMAPAAAEMKAALAEAKILSPGLPVVANVVAAAVTSPEEIRRLLVEQVTGQVRWRESVLYMKTEGVTELIELGAGKVLTGLTKRIDGDLSGRAVGTPADIDDFAKTL